MSVPTRVTAVARKRPRLLRQKCRWQVTPKHAYTLVPAKSEWADYAAVLAKCRNLSGNELTRYSSGNTRSQSSQLAEPLWTDPGLKSGISVRELISNLKRKRKREVNCRIFSKILAREKNATITSGLTDTRACSISTRTWYIRQSGHLPRSGSCGRIN